MNPRDAFDTYASTKPTQTYTRALWKLYNILSHRARSHAVTTIKYYHQQSRISHVVMFWKNLLLLYQKNKKNLRLKGC